MAQEELAKTAAVRLKNGVLSTNDFCVKSVQNLKFPQICTKDLQLKLYKNGITRLL